ncbi:MAG: PEP/pyruvate-binding domain-containing protein [Desulfobacterales bacterium]|nr:PEP/pyruvate-binding domain-containing protein [Desulfobacterales bacterium]MBF0396947.1 PEP/pyruvate-binding domain-containing protein [Desulfobacterales bacterium]
MYTKTFENISRKDVSTAGGKGSFLGELTHCGVLVPPGFVVLTNAFSYFLDSQGLSTQINDALIAMRHGKVSAENVSNKIFSQIMKSTIPNDIVSEIVREHEALGAKLVAVRSSATAEDHAEHSWAGQLESYLNVTTETLLFQVKKCWASLFSQRAIAYRFRDTDNIEAIEVAVVIQKMINPEVAGIAFSVDPVTENRDEMIIEAVFGLGESIVGGQITPDHYRVSKISLDVTYLFQSPQEKGIYRLDDGSTGWRRIDASKASLQKINNIEIAKLAKIVISIEKLAGFPCDIEWAYNHGEFYIVQCRPITTLI